MRSRHFSGRSLVAIILVIALVCTFGYSLYDIQIVNGEYYRAQNSTVKTYTVSIEAARGSILDRSGNELAGVRAQNNIELFKTNIGNEELNQAILKLVNLLNEYQISYTDTFPIKIEPYEFTIKDEELAKWKKTYKIDENASPTEALDRKSVV